MAQDFSSADKSEIFWKDFNSYRFDKERHHTAMWKDFNSYSFDKDRHHTAKHYLTF